MMNVSLTHKFFFNFLFSEKQTTGESMNVITDLIMTELKAELENMKATWIAPDIHKQLKMDLSKVTSERDIFKVKFFLNPFIVESGYGSCCHCYYYCHHSPLIRQTCV